MLQIFSLSSNVDFGCVEWDDNNFEVLKIRLRHWNAAIPDEVFDLLLDVNGYYENEEEGDDQQDDDHHHPDRIQFRLAFWSGYVRDASDVFERNIIVIVIVVVIVIDGIHFLQKFYFSVLTKAMHIVSKISKISNVSKVMKI